MFVPNWPNKTSETNHDLKSLIFCKYLCTRTHVTQTTVKTTTQKKTWFTVRKVFVFV